MTRNSSRAVVRQSKSNVSYIQGNTVRKLQVAEPYSNEEKSIHKINEERQYKREQNKRIHRANQLNFLYTLGVTAVVAVFFAVCYQYLNLQSEVKNNAAVISELESQLNTLTNENDEMEIEVKAGIDYDDIYHIAVDELGMIYPDKNQVIQYKSGESEYVKQYQDIPYAD